MIELKELEADGYKFKFNPEVLDDVELLDLFGDITKNEDPSILIKLLKFVLKEDTYNDMYKFFKKRDGRFKISSAKDVLEQVMSCFPK